MKILAIETSCDDTGIAILEVKKNKKGENPDFLVLANLVASQIEVHKKYGGVFPAMAKREHQRNLLSTFLKALKKSKLLISNFQFPISNKFFNDKISKIKTILEREPELVKKLILFLKKYQKPDVDFIAITNGPGLEPCLWVGINFARAISYFWDIPIIPVNHIEGHVLVNFLSQNKIEFPAIALVVSGGHTQLILINKIGNYKILGETRDDAAGECFDKAAKILGLGYPGGPAIAKIVSQWKSQIPNPKSQTNLKFQIPKLPRPMLNDKTYDFSFSGLKTAVLYSWQKIKPTLIMSDRSSKRLAIMQMAAEIQQAIIDVLLKKTFRAAEDYNAKTIILGGGVSANQELRKQFQKAVSGSIPGIDPINLIFPEPNSSTDNGLMIAIAGYFNTKKGGERVSATWQNLKADSNLRIGE